MVSLNPIDDTVDDNVIQPAQAVEDTFGEQYFPQQMSWYAPEGPQGLMEAGARKVRENPWAAVGVAVGAAMFLAMFGGSLLRAGAAGLSMATRMKSGDAGDESRGRCDCCECD